MKKAATFLFVLFLPSFLSAQELGSHSKPLDVARASFPELVALSEARQTGAFMEAKWKFEHDEFLNPFQAQRLVREIEAEAAPITENFHKLYRGEGIHLLLEGFPVRFVDYNFDTGIYAVCHPTSIFRFWDTETGGYNGLTLEHNAGGVTSAYFSLSGPSPRFVSCGIQQVEATWLGGRRVDAGLRNSAIGVALEESVAERVYEFTDTEFVSNTVSSVICVLAISDRSRQCQILAARFHLAHEGSYYHLYWSSGKEAVLEPDDGDFESYTQRLIDFSRR